MPPKHRADRAASAFLWRRSAGQVMSDKISYHLLGPENAGLLAASDLFDGPVDPGQLRAFLAREGHALVFAQVGGRVAGFASGAELLHPDKPPEFYINEVGVANDLRRQGIATALVGRLIARARDRGCGAVWLATETDNDAARALYRRMGAEESEPVVLYGWDLGAENPPP
jgi:ribosomal protein S18 acetylase RimI-like enzyme